VLLWNTGVEIMEAGIKFVVGQEYFYRFTCDHDTKAYMTVVSRTDKSIVVQESGERKPRRIKLREWDGVEQAYAANYSMAGVWSANKLSDRAPKASVEATAAPEPEALANCIPFPSKAPTASPEPLPSLSRAEALPMVALGRKILTEALRTMGQQTEIDLIEAILDRDHWKMLETLRGAIAAGKAG
jgi:hypothetical protein